MKKTLPVLGVVLCLSLGHPLQAQDPASEPAIIASAATFDAAQLDQLLGPIALYPDALIALMLPAATDSSDIVLAARFLRDGGDTDQAENQPWDESVRALARYPDVLKWMDLNLAWTKQLGEAFLAQPAEVMNAVQRLRAAARAAGTLVDTPQQQVVVDNSAISIMPAQPDVIYVPYYDPTIVYVSSPRYYSAPLFSFSPAYATGFWLSYNLDWQRHRVWCVNPPERERYWRENYFSWHRPTPRGQIAYASTPRYYREWTPRTGPSHARPSGASRVTAAVARPPIVTDAPRYDRRSNDAGTERWRDERNAPTGNYRSGVSRAPAPSRATAPAAVSQPLANPLPQPLTSPLPSRLPDVQPATAPRPTTAPAYRGGVDRERGERTTGPRNTAPAHSQTAPPATTAPRVFPGNATHSASPDRPNFNRSRPSIAPAAPATSAAPAAPAAPTTTYVSRGRQAAPETPPAAQPQSAQATNSNDNRGNANGPSEERHAPPIGRARFGR